MNLIVNVMERAYYYSIVFLIILSSCSSGKEKSDRDKENLHDEVCLTITQEYIRENLIGTEITKYNRYGKYLYKKSKSILFDNWENETYSYDAKGRLQIEKKDNYIFVSDSGRINYPKYKKYEYGRSGNSILKEYTNSEANLTSISYIKETDLEIQTTRIEHKFDLTKQRYYNDTTIFKSFYVNYWDKNIKKTKEIKGKRVLETLYKYENGNCIQSHKKDKIVYTDTILVYQYTNFQDKDNKTPTYIYQQINTNIVEEYKYDEFGNIIHYIKHDKTANEIEEEYYEYIYDSHGNWIEKHVYDTLHEPIRYSKRVIEYYPKDPTTGSIDYSWEQIDSPCLKQYQYESIREQKKDFYFRDDFVFKQFYATMNQEHSQYRIVGKPKIIYKQDSIYHVNFNAISPYGGLNENYTVQITLHIDTDTYDFNVIKGFFL